MRLNISNEMKNETTRNVIHSNFDTTDSAVDCPSSPLANKSGTLCNFLRGTITFVFFSSTAGAMLILDVFRFLHNV